MITVIIPTYNHAQYLPRAIAAVALQGKCIRKIVVVNDGSRDNTEEVVNNIRVHEDRVCLISLEDNKGSANAVEMGMAYVDTDYFALLAADDFLLPGWADHSLSALVAHNEAAFCVSNTYLCNEDKSDINRTEMPNEYNDSYLDKIQFGNSLIRYGVWFPSNTVLFRSSKYDASFLVKEAESFCDGLMLSLLGLKNGVCVVEQPLGCFFRRRSSLSGSVAETLAALRIIPAIGNCLLSKDPDRGIDLRVANKIFKRRLFLYLNEDLAFVFDGYSKNAMKYLNKSQSRIVRGYFRILFWVIKLTSFLLLTPEDVIIRLKMFKKYVVSKEQSDFINCQDLLLTRYYSELPML